MGKIIALTFLSIIPAVIELTYFVVNGGMQWPMTWANEVTAWCVLLSPAAILACIIGLKSHKYIQVVFPCIVLLYAITRLLMCGIDASSKGDAAQLELLQFWTLQWGYW